MDGDYACYVSCNSHLCKEKSYKAIERGKTVILVESFLYDICFFFPVMSNLMASICWNILAHKAVEISDVGVKIYQKPESNDIFELRRKKNPPLCKEDENPDSAW